MACNRDIFTLPKWNRVLFTKHSRPGTQEFPALYGTQQIHAAPREPIWRTCDVYLWSPLAHRWHIQDVHGSNPSRKPTVLPKIVMILHSSLPYILSCAWVTRRGFGLQIGFIDHFNTRLVTTLNYSTIADVHSLQITTAHAKSFQSVSSPVVSW
jgi:hypothetical protein